MTDMPKVGPTWQGNQPLQRRRDGATDPAPRAPMTVDNQQAPEVERRRNPDRRRERRKVVIERRMEQRRRRRIDTRV